MKSRLEDKGLELATEKTKLRLLNRKCIPLKINITTCDTTLTMRKVLNYLGIRLDLTLMFWAQIRHALTKAAKVTFLPSGLMANRDRRLLMLAITDPILLYGTKVVCRMKIL